MSLFMNLMDFWRAIRNRCFDLGSVIHWHPLKVTWANAFGWLRVTYFSVDDIIKALMVNGLQFLSVCNITSYLLWLHKSKQRLEFFKSPLYICCWIISNNMSRLFILDRLYKWWGCWDVTNLLWSIPPASADRTVIFTCGVLLIQR